MVFEDMQADTKESACIILKWTGRTMWECEFMVIVGLTENDLDLRMI